MTNKAKMGIAGAFLLGASALLTEANAQDITIGGDTAIGAAPETQPLRPAEPTRQSCAADLDNPDVLKTSMINGPAANDYIRVAIGYIEDKEATAETGELTYEFTGCVYLKYANRPTEVQFVYDPNGTRGIDRLNRLQNEYPAQHVNMCRNRVGGNVPDECATLDALPINRPPAP